MVEIENDTNRVICVLAVCIEKFHYSIKSLLGFMTVFTHKFTSKVKHQEILLVKTMC